MALSIKVEEFFARMDPDLLDLQEMDGFEEVANGIYEETQKLSGELMLTGHNEPGRVDVDRLAFILVMQSEAINKLVDEIEALRPSIRFITSALLGNTEDQPNGDA